MDNDQKSAPESADEPFGRCAPRGALARLIAATASMPDNWLGRRVAFVLRRIGLALARAPLDVERLGVRLRLHPFDNVCERRLLFTPQYFDPAERDELCRRVTADFVFVDIGANIGAYALLVAAKAGPGARILAIEPQPIIFDRLIRNVTENSGGTIKALACAVADKDGELTLFVDRRNRGESSVTYLRPEGQAGGQALVPARTLLAILQEEQLSRVDALKLDVEGAEDLVLEPFFRNAPPTLWPRLIIVETLAKDGPAITELLERNGYRTILSTKMNRVLERETAVDSGESVETDKSGELTGEQPPAGRQGNATSS